MTTQPYSDKETPWTIYPDWPFGWHEAKRRQRQTAQDCEVPIEFTNTIGLKFRLIPAGAFIMGSPEDVADPDLLETRRPVRITRPFYLGAYMVTQSDWGELRETRRWRGNSQTGEGSDVPATKITWREANAFASELASHEGRTYRLPTEAEWEYACRVGDAFLWPAICGLYEEANWGWGYEKGRSGPNPWGLFDMFNGVLELSSDWDSVISSNSKPTDDPLGPTEGGVHVTRGYCYEPCCFIEESVCLDDCRLGDTDYCHLLTMGNSHPWLRTIDHSDAGPIGFRLVCQLDVEDAS